MFKSQAVVDRYIDALAYTFGVQRVALNVVSRVACLRWDPFDHGFLAQTAAAKGLVVGTFMVTGSDGRVLIQGSDGMVSSIGASPFDRLRSVI